MDILVLNEVGVAVEGFMVDLTDKTGQVVKGHHILLKVWMATMNPLWINSPTA